MQVRFSLNQMDKFARASDTAWSATFAVRRLLQIPEGAPFALLACYHTIYVQKIFADTFRKDSATETLNLDHTTDLLSFADANLCFDEDDLRTCIEACLAMDYLKKVLHDQALSEKFDFKLVRKAKKNLNDALDAVNW